MKVKHIVLAGGCFWGLQALVDQFRGVMSTTVGYANSKDGFLASVSSQKVPFLKEAGVPACNVSYQAVCSGETGAAEAVTIEYDADTISLGSLLDIFFSVIDPAAENYQGNDVGTQYRSGVYYLSSEAGDEAAIRQKIEIVKQSTKKHVVTEVLALRNYTVAEDYHQKYLNNRPEGYCHINVSAAKVKFSSLL